jgi:hypothetical protein
MAGVAGAGLNFAGFPVTYLTGATATQATVIGGLWLAARRVPAVWRRGPAWALLAAGVGWFVMRLVR